MERKIDLIIPVYKPDQIFEQLLKRIAKQTLRPNRIIVVNTEKGLWESAKIDKSPFESGDLDGIPVELHHVTAMEFNHGGTRRWAASQSEAEYLMFMTQDAMPADENLIENLWNAFSLGENVGGAYARQLPAADCGFLECYTRSFNYPDETRVKSEKDIPVLGIKTFFCSNVCSMYRKSAYEAVGGFPSHTIFNEDMICAGHMIQSGYQIVYEANARVIHSHNYSGMQQLKRNFDLAVSQTDFPEVFAQVKSESEGVRLVLNSAGYLIHEKKIYLIPKLVWQSGCKYLGYKLGRNYQKLPKQMILKLTSSKNYWKQKNPS